MKTFLATAVFLLISATVFPSSFRAETYSTTFTKEGNTYVVTKTVTNTQITIETKIYDSSGKLINTKTTNKTPQPAPTKSSATEPATKIVTSPSPTPTTAATPTPIQIKSDIPVQVDEKSAEISLDTPDGPLKMTVTPETITLSAKNLGLTDITEIKISNSDDGIAQYQVRGTKQQTLFAFIPVYLPTTLAFNYQTGSLEKTHQPIFVKIIDAISF